MNFKINTICMILLVASATAYSASASNELKEYTKTVNKEFSYKDGQTVVINNRYGKVDIETSDRSDVRFEILITVEASSQGRADDIMEKIEIDFDESSDEISAKTSIASGSWNKKGGSYNIDYRVMIPVRANLSLDNKYGDIALSDISGDVNIQLKYGNGNLQDVDGDLKLSLGYVRSFNMGSVTGQSDFNMAYSHASFVSLRTAVLGSKYSHLNIEAIDELTSRTSYDELNIDDIGRLSNQGKYDQIRIGSVGSLSLKTRYTQFRADKISGDAIFDTGYGSVRVDEVDKTATSLDIQAKYTSYSLGIPGGFKADVQTEYANFTYPGEMNFSERIKDTKKSSWKGAKGNGGPSIKAILKYGDLKISD